MNDADFARQQQRVNALVARWLPICGLGGDDWDIEIIVEREAALTDRGWQVAAQCAARWEHLDAELRFFADAIVSETDEVLERHVIHECCHVLVNELRPKAKSLMGDWLAHEERVVSQLEAAFWRASRAVLPTTAPLPASIARAEGA